jgi:hypothetical protein
MREHEGESGILIVKGDGMSFEQNAQVARGVTSQICSI